MVYGTNDNLYKDPWLVAVYEATSGWADETDFYLSLAAENKLRILDLGCGTGLLCNAYAGHEHEVVEWIQPRRCCRSPGNSHMQARFSGFIPPASTATST